MKPLFDSLERPLGRFARYVKSHKWVLTVFRVLFYLLGTILLFSWGVNAGNDVLSEYGSCYVHPLVLEFGLRLGVWSAWWVWLVFRFFSFLGLFKRNPKNINDLT